MRTRVLIQLGGIAGLVLVALALAGCSAAINPLQVEAAQTAARVKTALVNDDRLGIRAIEVRVVDGVVELSGNVASEDEAAHAVSLAQRVPGVTRVESRLRVGPAEVPREEPQIGGRPRPAGRGMDVEFAELEEKHDLLTVGAGLRIVEPGGVAQGTRWQLSPLIRLGNRRGFGPAIAFDWYSAYPRATERVSGDVGRVNIRPVMAGLRYTVPVGRLSFGPSLVGGIAFNRLSVADEGDVERLAIGVSSSMAWRAAMSVWYETSRRTAVHASLGRLFTRPRFTIVEDGVLRDRSANADATILLVGVAYKVF